jgi:hypothetical protein
LRHGKELKGCWRLKKKESSPYFYFMDPPLDIEEGIIPLFLFYGSAPRHRRGQRGTSRIYMRTDSAIELDVAMVMQPEEGARGVKPSLMMCNITNFL